MAEHRLSGHFFLSKYEYLHSYFLMFYRKIVNGMSGKLLLCRSVMQLKMYTDGPVGMILPHLYAMHVPD